MTKIFLTRHGQTEWNKKGISQGHKNSDLTDLGVNQAKWLGAKLEDEKIDLIVTSSLGRAKDTALHIRGKRDIEIIESDNLKEMHMGEWEGRSHVEIEELWPENVHDFRNQPHKYTPMEPAESIQNLIHRTSTELRDIAKKHKNKNILIVTHGIALHALFAHIEDKPLEKFWEDDMKSTCLNVIEIKDDDIKVLVKGDISHYKD